MRKFLFFIGLATAFIAVNTCSSVFDKSTRSVRFKAVCDSPSKDWYALSKEEAERKVVFYDSLGYFNCRVVDLKKKKRGKILVTPKIKRYS